MSQVKISPRGGVQYRRIRKFAALSVGAFLAMIFNFKATPAQAGGLPSCSKFGAAITINSSNDVTYSSNIDQSTVTWSKTNSTLTLNNYNGGSICSDGYSPLTIILSGENTVSSTLGIGIMVPNGSLAIEGDGSLDIIITNRIDDDNVSYIAFTTKNTTVINGGAINVSIPQITAGETCAASFIFEGHFIMNNGSLTANCTILNQTTGGGFIMNGGTISVAQVFASGFFNQNGGILNIIPTNSFTPIGKEYSADLCLISPNYVFNGGTTRIDCSNYHGQPHAMTLLAGNESRTEEYDEMGMPYTIDKHSVIISLSALNSAVGIPHDIPSDKLGTSSVFTPLDAAAAVFNDGDISIKGSITPIVGSFEVCNKEEDPLESCDRTILQDITTEQFIKLGEGMVTEPANLTPYNFMVSDGDEDLSGMFVFTDGTNIDDTYVHYEGDGSAEVSDNVIKTLHIHKAGVPIPSADGDEEENVDEKEENPNTIDTKIIGLALGTLFAIIAEGVIIGDLYRRLFSYEKEIANIDEKSDSTPEDTSDKA